MNCRELQPWLQAYLDGELPIERALELETHLSSCEACQLEERFWRALRGSLHRSVRAEGAIRVEFRQAMKTLLEQEAVLEEGRGQPLTHALARSPAEGSAKSPLALRQRARRSGAIRNWSRNGLVAALAVAVAGLLFVRLRAPESAKVLAMEEAARPRPAGSEGRVGVAAAEAAQDVGLVNDALVDEFLKLHSMPPPPRITEPGLLSRFERDVGVRVQLPQWTTRQSVFLQGASVGRVRRGRVAFLRYRTRDDHRVTLYVYDPARIPLHAALPPRVISPVPVYQVRRRGYSIAAMARQGVGYAIASDLDSDENLELIGSLH